MSNYTTVSLDEDQAVLDVSPDFVSTNSLGLVASYYTDQACTQVFNLETDTITEDTTVYVYWETDPRWFVVEDGVITGTTTAVVDFDKSQIEKLILPRCDASGTAITTFGPDDQTTSPFYGTFASSFTALTEIVIPEGYTTIGKYVMAVEKETAISDQQSAFVVRIPSTIETIGTMAFTNVKVGEYIVSEENANFASKDGCLVDKAQTMLFRYPSGKTATAVDLTGFTGIDAGAFYANTTITEMKIPALTTKTNAAFDGLVNLSVVHFDFTITDSVMFSRKLFSSYLGKSNYSLWKETSTIYVNSEADKVALTNILIYGKTQPVLEDDGTGSMDEPISDGTFCDDGYRDSLISNIEVISAE